MPLPQGFINGPYIQQIKCYIHLRVQTNNENLAQTPQKLRVPRNSEPLLIQKKDMHVSVAVTLIMQVVNSHWYAQKLYVLGCLQTRCQGTHQPSHMNII